MEPMGLKGATKAMRHRQIRKVTGAGHKSSLSEIDSE